MGYKRVDYDEMFGRRYGSIVVRGIVAIQDFSKSPTYWKWYCECDCGGNITSSANSIRSGDVTGCGCGNSGGYEELFDFRDGNLSVLGFVAVQNLSKKPSSWKWLCECSCGELVIRSARSLRRQYTRGCCNCCLPKGEDHPSWKGGITQRPSMDTWRESVFVRDKFTCKACGKTGGNLNAHHLYGVANRPEMVTDVDNGITLCEKCHRAFHSWCGGTQISVTPSKYAKWAGGFFN